MQEMIKVYLGEVFLNEVPKQNEQNIRAIFAGTENERLLRITSDDQEKQMAVNRDIALSRLRDSRNATPLHNPLIQEIDEATFAMVDDFKLKAKKA